MSNKEEIKEQKKSLRRYKGLDALKDSEGGKTLIEFHENAIDIQINWLVSNYKDGKEIEIRSRIAKIQASKENIDMIANAKENAKVVKEELNSLKE